ncbi:MAG: molybdopterin-dependent oxidoreductase, partial [bacterium]|nr:molybdopterin-dependent oxidoreductase [bacterium]
DAARTSLRLGADEVILLYRRTRKEMPANEMEIVAAEEEGVKMEFLAAPTKVNKDEKGRMKSISANRMELGEPDDSGRRRPVVIEGSEYELSADWIVSAIGQEPDLDGIESDNKIETTRWKTIEAAEGTFITDRPGVFAGGDVVTGPADAVDAIAAGRIAARAIDKYIKTGVADPLRNRFESKRDSFHKITPEDLPDIPKGDRHHMPELPAAERIHTFEEVETGFTDEMAKTEALRCAECGCDAGLACTLQDYGTEYGVDQERFIGAFNRYKPDTRHPFVKIDSNKCIRCGRCVSVCSEILNVSALGFVNRGFKTIVKPALEKALHETNCVSCGNCIDVCPTGALVEKMPFRRSGPWKMEHVFNVCNYCSVGCNITINVKTSDLFFVTGAPPESGPNRGELCVKGRFGYQHYLDGTRATRPMVRKGDKMVECSWDEAFDAIRDGLKPVLDTHGKDSVMVSASPKLSNEELYLTGRFARAVVGTNNITSFHRQINEADYHALDDMIGSTFATASYDDVENADLYLFLGGNPSLENPVLGWRMKRKMRHGTEAVVINSTEIDLVSHASAWADPRRGTATVLLNGIMGEIIRSGKIDESFISEKTANFKQIKESLLSNDLEETATITGVASEKILKIAELLSRPELKIVASYNLESRIDRATNDLKALMTLMMLLGKVGSKGSGLVLTTSQCNLNGMQSSGFDRHILPGGTTIDDPKGLRELSAVWQTDIANLFKESGVNLQRKIREDKIRAAFVFGENPAVAEQFNSFVDHLDFLVVADMFKTETAQMADVFLPMSGYLETEGHLTAWDGSAQYTKPIGEPVNGLTNIEIIKKLAASMGGEIHYNKFEEIVSELDYLKEKLSPSINGSFPTSDGKAHFVLYSSEISSRAAKVPQVLEIDARMARQMQKIRA